MKKIKKLQFQKNIKISGISFEYDGYKIFDNFNLDIKKSISWVLSDQVVQEKQP